MGSETVGSFLPLDSLLEGIAMRGSRCHKLPDGRDHRTHACLPDAPSNTHFDDATGPEYTALIDPPPPSSPQMLRVTSFCLAAFPWSHPSSRLNSAIVATWCGRPSWSSHPLSTYWKRFLLCPPGREDF